MDKQVNDTAEVIAVLDAVRDVLRVPERWTKVYYAIDEAGERTRPNSQHAVAWCILGAVTKATQWHRHDAACEALRETLPLDGDNLATFNDHPDTTHADVLRLLDDTIARLRHQEP